MHNQPQEGQHLTAASLQPPAAEADVAVSAQPVVRKQPSVAELQATFKRCHDSHQDAMARYRQSAESSRVSHYELRKAAHCALQAAASCLDVS